MGVVGGPAGMARWPSPPIAADLGPFAVLHVTGPDIVDTVSGELTCAYMTAAPTGELSVVHGPYLWLVATGGRVQPSRGCHRRADNEEGAWQGSSPAVYLSDGTPTTDTLVRSDLSLSYGSGAGATSSSMMRPRMSAG